MINYNQPTTKKEVLGAADSEYPINQYLLFIVWAQRIEGLDLLITT